MDIDSAIKNAITSAEVEGAKIDDDIKVKLKEFAQGKITFEQYRDYVLQKHNIQPIDRL